MNSVQVFLFLAMNTSEILQKPSRVFQSYFLSRNYFSSEYSLCNLKRSHYLVENKTSSYSKLIRKKGNLG